MLKYRQSYTCVEVIGIPVEGVAGIYRLILGTFPVIDPAARGKGPAKCADSEPIRTALRRAGPDAQLIDLRESPIRPLRNHARAPRRRNGRPKLLGHDGHPAGLSNGKPPALPVPAKARDTA